MNRCTSRRATDSVLTNLRKRKQERKIARITMVLVKSVPSLLTLVFFIGVVNAKLTLLPGSSAGHGLLQDDNGTVYDLDQLEPWTDFLSPDHFALSSDGTMTELGWNTSFLPPVWRGNIKDALVQVVIDWKGAVTFAEIRREDENGVFYVDTTSLEVPEAFTIVENEGESQQRDEFFEEAPPLPERFPSINHGSDRRSRNLVSTSCSEFRIIKIGIVYDSEFCGTYGGHRRARNRIMAIVASASLHYERDMCVKLQLTNVLTPDSTCGGESNTFSSFERKWACGIKPNFLSGFGSWVAQQRPSTDLDPNALIHMFTGYASSGSLGCAYRGTLCWSRFSFGVEYITRRSSIFIQGIIFAHEVGHNLNAVHVSNDERDYIMESRLTSATDGFSVSTVNRILSFLDLPDITCDGVEKAPSPSPTANPTASPTADPTASPVQPTKSPVAYSLSNDSPTTSPIQNKATPVHVPGNLCEEASLGWCAHQAAGYTCFPLSEVTDVLSEQGCKVQSLRLARCNTKKVKVFKTALPEELDVCEDTCLMFSGDMICVLAQERGRVRLTFRDGDGDPFALNLFLRVVNNPKRKCRQTNLPCVGPE